MYITINTNEAIDRLLEDTNASWTVEQALALVEYYEELDEFSRTPIEIDVVTIRCDWACDTLRGVVNDYDIHEVGNIETREEQLDWLRDQTQVIELKNDVILYMQF